MEISGKIIEVLPMKSGVTQAGKSWRSQDFVIEELKEKFPNRMCFSVFGPEKIDKFGLQLGQTVTVYFDCDIRTYNGKIYNNIQAFNVRRYNPEQPQPQMQAGQDGVAPAPSPANKEDLPF